MRHSQIATALLAALVLASPAYAVDGVIEINHARALAGGVTATDTAGYPVTIDASGSYRLTGDLVVPDENTTAVRVESSADHVALDASPDPAAGYVAGGRSDRHRRRRLVIPRT